MPTAMPELMKEGATLVTTAADIRRVIESRTASRCGLGIGDYLLAVSAEAAIAFSSINVVTNANRLRRVDIRKA